MPTPTRKSRLTDPAASRVLHEMLSIPTAPFAEHKVIDYVGAFCAKRKGATLTRDDAGNVLVRVKIGRRTVARPVCITAHLDHPGFVADRMISTNTVRAFWRGGVAPEYFVGARVRFFVGESWLKGRIRSIKTVGRKPKRKVETALIDVTKPVPQGAVGMWDFPDPRVRGNRIHARGCDDIAGAAAMLCAIDKLVRGKRACDAYFLFTRAEEVGFVGAIAACRLGTIPKKCVVVAMETSSERPNAKMGDGPILRVGDKASTFTPAATAHCHRIALDLASSEKTFTFQRKLMDGGTCESSAYCTLGYDATGICIALGNYHNVDAKRGKLGPEYVDLRDFHNVVKWFVALATSQRRYSGRNDALEARMGDIEKTYKQLLEASRAVPR